MRRFAWLACALSLSACSKPEPPKITPRSATVTTVDARGLGMKLELDAYNPNGFPLVARSVSGTLTLGEGGAELGKATSTPNGSIPAKGSAVVTSELFVSWTNVAALAPFALSNKPVPYTFKAVATVGGDKLNVEVPFTVKGELTRTQVLSIGLAGLSPTNLPAPPPLPALPQ